MLNLKGCKSKINILFFSKTKDLQSNTWHESMMLSVESDVRKTVDTPLKTNGWILDTQNDGLEKVSNSL